MKKLCSLLLCAALILSFTPALAAEGDYTGKTVILYTQNLRGNLDVYPLLAQAKREYEARGADVLLADCGNFLQGSAAANASRGEAVYAMMDAVGYDVAALGMYDFSFTDAVTGYPYHGNVTRYHTQAMLQDGCVETVYNRDREGKVTAVLPAKAPASFQTVCSNVSPNKAYSFRESVTLTTRGGVTLTFFGYADPAASRGVQDGFVAVTPPKLPQQTDGALTVCLTNAGDALDVSAFDVVCGVPTGEQSVSGAWVIDNATGQAQWQPVLPDGVQPDPDEEISALVRQWKDRTPAPLFTCAVTLNGSDKANWNGETNLGDLVTDALKWYAETYIDGMDKTRPVIALQNGGNCDDFLYPGDVTEVDLLKALPFSPMGVGVLTLTGAQLLETLEAATQCPDCPGFPQVSGLSYTLNRAESYDGGAAYGKFFEADSVNRITVTSLSGGSAFDPAATYNVVCDNFLINGNDTYYTLKAAKEAGARYLNNGPGVKVRDIVTMYVNETCHGLLSGYGAPQGRIALQDFLDVPAGHWALEAVTWAVEQGVTQGTGEGCFSPDRECTVWEIETLLARAVGAPEPPFDPDSPLCTRSTAMDLLWQLAGSPMTDTLSGFADVDLLSSLTPFSVAWAVEKGITTGTSETTFSPHKTCTRAEIVTFLCRARPWVGA